MISRRRFHPWLVRAALPPLLLLLGGCSTLGYYTQAIKGELDVLHRARPVAEVVGDPATPAAVRDKLRRIQAMRDYASRELGLPDNASYRRYSDLQRPFVVWNVIAAPEFSVRAVQSCFPIAGCVSYRGWYSRADARADAQQHLQQGYDVHLDGIPAYSTLGWFDDPLLNTFIQYPDAEVARLIFHELAHQLLYVSGDTSFNESFAVSVEEEGVKRWLDAAADPAERARYAAFDQRRQAFVALIGAYRDKLKAYYAQSEGQPETQRRAGKARLFAELDRDYEALKVAWGGYAGYDRFMGKGPAPAVTAGSAPAPTAGSAPATTAGSAPATTAGSAPAPTAGSAPTPTAGSAPAPVAESAPAPKGTALAPTGTAPGIGTGPQPGAGKGVAPVSPGEPWNGPNNALLAAVVSYSEWLPAFRNLIARDRGDLGAYYRDVKALAALPREEREKKLRALM